MIDNEFQSLIPSLTKEEYALLEQSIINEGCRDPILTWSGVIVDGHNRYAICQKHSIDFQTKEIKFSDRDTAKVWIIHNQFGRRNLAPYQRAELALMLEPLISERARKQQGQRTDLCQKSDRSKTIDTKKEVAKAAGLSHDTIHKVKTIRDKADEKVKNKVRTGEVSINKAYKDIKKKTKETEDKIKLEDAQSKISEAQRTDIRSICDIRHCSMRELLTSGVKPDCIITDPPYPKEFIPLYIELAELSKDIPVVAVMCGQTYLPEIIANMCKHLRYRWTLAYLTPGASMRQWNTNIECAWKPVLLFGDTDKFVFDVFRSDKPDKAFHNWGQSESGIGALVKGLSEPDQLVCDPFLGAGTTAVVSLRLSRRFVGCDIDAEAIKNSILRVESDVNKR